MSAGVQTKVQAGPAQSFTPVGTGLLQRKCTLCNTPGLAGDSERDEEGLSLQRGPVDQAEPSAVLPIVHEALHSHGQPLYPETRAFMEPRFGHDFNGVSILRDAPTMIQAKLTIGQPNDQYEQEADRVADKVMRMPELQVPRQECSKMARLGLQAKLRVNEPGDIYEQEADRIADQVIAMPVYSGSGGALSVIQRLTGESTSQTDTVPVSVDQALTSPGTPLEPVLQQGIEQRFGCDFSHVRVHTGTAAERSAGDRSEVPDLANVVAQGTSGPILGLPYRSELERLAGSDLGHIRTYRNKEAASACETVDALAFTTGSEIVFGDPSPIKSVVAHEVAHVLQQGKKSVGEAASSLHLSDPAGPAETEASRFSREVITGQQPSQLSQVAGDARFVFRTNRGYRRLPRLDDRHTRIAIDIPLEPETSVDSVIQDISDSLGGYVSRSLAPGLVQNWLNRDQQGTADFVRSQIAHARDAGDSHLEIEVVCAWDGSVVSIDLWDRYATVTAPPELEREVIAGPERRGPTLAPEPWYPPIPPPRRSESIVPYERPETRIVPRGEGAVTERALAPREEPVTAIVSRPEAKLGETSIVPHEQPIESIVPARRILLDASVIGEINRGNVHAARTLQTLLRSSARIEITTQSFGELTAQPGRPVTHIGPGLPRTAAANRDLLRDLQISVAPTVGSVTARANAYARVETHMRASISVADRINLVQAGLLNAEFWTMERRLTTQEVAISRHLGVRLAPECRTVHVPRGAGVQRPREDYRVARQLLGLEPITVSVTGTVSRPPAGRGGPPRGGTPPVPSVSSTGTSIIPAPSTSIVPHTESTPRGETAITVHAEFEPARGTTAIVPHPESEPGRTTAIVPHAESESGRSTTVIPHPESIRPSQASSGSGRRHRLARRAAGAAGRGGALISVINDYLVMLESYRELERTVQSYNSTFFARIGGECYQHWYTQGIVTVCAPPSPARLRQWLEGNIHTWREFEAFYDTAYITGFDIYQGQYGFHIGSSFYAGPTEESIDEVIRETIRRLEENERETIEQIRAVGRMEVRFRNHIPTDDRQVYPLSVRGVRSFLEPLCEGSALPTNAQFFIVGAARGVHWGSWSTRFYQVEGANVATVRAMRGQRGLVSVNDVYRVVTSRVLLED